MIGASNSLASRFLEKNSEIFVGGCVCHLAHILPVMQMMLSVVFLELMWKIFVLIASISLIKVQNGKENSQNILNSVINSLIDVF